MREEIRNILDKSGTRRSVGGLRSVDGEYLISEIQSYLIKKNIEILEGMKYIVGQFSEYQYIEINKRIDDKIRDIRKNKK